MTDHVYDLLLANESDVQMDIFSGNSAVCSDVVSAVSDVWSVVFSAVDSAVLSAASSAFEEELQ